MATLAAAAEWTVPDRVVAVALEPVESDADALASALALDPAVLRRLDGPVACLVTAEPEVHLARLEQRLRGRRAAIGPVVAVTDLRASLAMARSALGLSARGTLPDGVVRCEEHLVTLWLTGDPFLLDQLVDRSLGVFGPMTDRQRLRLGATLLSWLKNRGNIALIASDLAVHPQTVRYRMHRLVELLGPALDDPDSRFAMEVALRGVDLDHTGPDQA